jgi:HEAT repeat protein
MTLAPATRAALALLLTASVLAACKKPTPSTEALLQQLGSADHSLALGAAERLQRRGHPKATEYFQRLFVEGEGDIKQYSARMLGERPDPSSVPLLVGALQLSGVAAESLRFLLPQTQPAGEPPGLLLQNPVQKGDRDIEGLNEDILWSLANFRRPDTLPYFVAALSSGSASVRRAAGIGLVKLGGQIIPMLDREYHRVGNHSLHGPAALMEALGEFKNPGAIPLLIEGLGDLDGWTRRAAGEGLMKLGDFAEPKVREALQSKDEIVREQARDLLLHWKKGTKP